MAKNEKTSKKVGAIAGALSGEVIDSLIKELKEMKLTNSMRLDFAIAVLYQCKSVASSALAQVADKKKAARARKAKAGGND